MLSPHGRLGRSRTASTYVHCESCTAQRKAPESRQPHQAEMIQRAAPNIPSTVAPPPRPALIDITRASRRANALHGADDTSCARANADLCRSLGRRPRCQPRAVNSRCPRQAPSRSVLTAPQILIAVPRECPRSPVKKRVAPARRRAAPRRGHRADPMGRRGVGGAMRAPQASP